MKQLWALHIRRNSPNKPGDEYSYTVAKHLTNQASGSGGAMPQTAPHSWEYLSRALEQIGCDAFSIALLRKEIDAKGSDNINGLSLDASQLRVIGFTDL